MPRTKLELKEVPVRDALLAISDLYPICFVFREYGVLVTTQTKGRTLDSASIPPGSPDWQPVR